ncbi:MAG TPA: alanine--glyoxylate aminotransferase family protein [Gemmatimonadaceae bacterium]|nr:alanine--glyoxylate aminotransferase family protein [Gemmatimonadaceae bacterium]
MTHTIETPGVNSDAAPKQMSVLNPPERLLMGPGPSNPDPRVLAAMARSTVGHLDPYFVDLMDETMNGLRQVFRTQNHHTLPISGTGSAGLETIMLNLLEPGDSAIVLMIGHFGHRLAELAKRSGADVRTIEAAPGEIVDPSELAAMLAERPAKLVAFVHVETTTGACQPIEPIVEVARRYGALVAVDCVTSLGGMPIDVDGLGIDAAGSCTQKCIGAPPGLGPITVGPRAMAAVRARKASPSTWYLDLSLLFQYWGEDGASKKRAFHHTAPINSIYGIHEALRLILAEGLEERWVRHTAAHETLVRGLDKLGISLFTPASNRCPTINVISVPDGVNEANVRRRLLEAGVEMGGGLGALAGKVWRVGVMGHNAQAPRVERFIGALGEALSAEGWSA